MAIEKNNFKVGRFDSVGSPGSRDSMSTDEDDLRLRASGAESDEDDDFDDADSGAGSDDFDLLELGETGAEFCQVGSSTCSIPFELYDLPNLEEVLSVDVWNEYLTEEERFGLTKFLPDMDQETYMNTMMELFKGCNFHFGSPLQKLFDMLKGGLCEPRVALYREGQNSFDKREHYHFLKKHHNGLVSNLCQIRDAWLNCRGYSIEEKLRVLNIVKSQKSLMYEKEDMDNESSGREELNVRTWNRRSKDRKLGQMMGPSSLYGAGSHLDPCNVFEPANYRKQNNNGMLKLGDMKASSARQLVSGLPTLNPGSDLKSAANTPFTLPRQSKVAAIDTDLWPEGMREWMPGFDEIEDQVFGVDNQRHQSGSRKFSMDKQRFLVAGKKPKFVIGEELAMDGFVGLPLSSKGDLFFNGWNKLGTDLFDEKMKKVKQSDVGPSCDYLMKTKYPEIGHGFSDEVQLKPKKGLKGARGVLRDPDEFWHGQIGEEAFYVDPQYQYDDLNPKSKRMKVYKESSRIVKSHKASLPQTSNRYLTADVKRRHSREKLGESSMKNREANIILNGNVTESGSSDAYGDDETNPLMMRKLGYPSGFLEGQTSLIKKSNVDRKDKLPKKQKKRNSYLSERSLQCIEKKDDLGAPVYLQEIEEVAFPLKGKKKKMKKSKNREDISVQTSTGSKEGEFLHGPGSDERIKPRKSSKNYQSENGPNDGHAISPILNDPVEDKKTTEGSDNHYAVVEEDGVIEKLPTADEKRTSKRRKKGKSIQKSDAIASGGNSAKRKRKGKAVEKGGNDGGDDETFVDSQLQLEESDLLEKPGDKNNKDDGVALDNETLEMPKVDAGVFDVEVDNGPPKKSFTLITPTVYTDFSFSIIHLLSAVRVAMTSPLPEYSLNVGAPSEDAGVIQEVGTNDESILPNMDAAENSEQDPQVNAQYLTIQEIVDRVRSNPGDPCILETQEPLQDLVRGVLKSFSSRSAPSGAKGWKALVAYERSRKSWRWTGPCPHFSPDHETMEEVTSPEAWGLPHKMLVKLVDSFASWLKLGQETLQQLGSLPPPPLELMQLNVDEKERFRDLRAQKSLSTISPSSELVREYFRKEEFIRYSIPDRAFSYTAADGMKSFVAPLRRCGGKPTSKARDHFMLKRDRPAHVTILCLVRDAAARLPGSIGTRADVCTLIRDSQYVVEDVTDVQINQIVSGALDRLHYERDPCVQFDAERKLWKYLHREREEEDFVDDGTSSTKKWRRPKKDAAEPSDQGATVVYPGSEEQIGYDLCSDLNLDPTPIDEDKVVDPILSDDLGQNIVDICSNGAVHNGISQDQSMVWEGFDLNPLRDNKLLCQENSTNEDFDDETFGQEQPVGLLSASLL